MVPLYKNIKVFLASGWLVEGLWLVNQPEARQSETHDAFSFLYLLFLNHCIPSFDLISNVENDLPAG